MAKQVMFDQNARQRIFEGIRKLARAVKVTLGPSGRNVILDKKFGSPQATKDGVTVSKEIELEDPFENCGAKLANEAADKTNDKAGDGTTTAVVLVEAIYAEGLKALAAGYNPSAIKRGIDLAAERVVEELKTLSKPVSGSSDYRNIAMISSHYDGAIADLVSRAINKVGKDGVITVEEGKSFVTEIEEIDGLQFDKGYISPYFMTKPDSLVCEFEDAYLLLTDKKISNVHELVPLLEQTAQIGAALVVIAEEVEGEALAALVINKLRGILKVCAIKAPAFGDRRKAILQDIAVLTGGKVVSDDLGVKFETLKLKDLGRAKKITVEKERTTIVGGKGEKKAVEGRIAELKTLIEKTTSDYDREKYEERLAKLTGGVCILKVGGATEAEMKEKKFRVDDAVHAVKAAAQEGLVPGGGTAYLRTVPALVKLSKSLSEDEAVGVKIVMRALEAPAWNIARNAGFDASTVVEDIKSRSDWHGFDATTGQFTDLLKAGVIDPAKVSRVALQNASSVASCLLTMNTVVTELKEDKKKVEGAVK